MTSMKIATVGSLGNIGKPLVEKLTKAGHEVTVITSDPERVNAIEALGATAAIGSVLDRDFLAATFSGKDAVYTMTPFPAGSYFQKDFDVEGNLVRIASTYKYALEKSGVRKLVHLSSIGADKEKGNGLLSSYYPVEQTLLSLPPEISLVILRPVSFYYNLLAFIDTIKKQGIIATNYGGDQVKPWVSPVDIADVAFVELTSSDMARKVRYVASDEVSCDEIASILGKTIGKPDLKWIIIPDEQYLKGLISAGMNPDVARGFVQMNAVARTDSLYDDYNRNYPVLGKVKIRDYALDFAEAYNRH